MPESKSPPASEADRRSAAATIVFQCPNGHRITVPAKLAGKRGACSKCGTAVVIPPATAPAPAPGAAAPVAPAPPSDALVAGDEVPGGDEGTITLKSPVPWVPPTNAAGMAAPPLPAAAPRAATRADEPMPPPAAAPAADRSPVPFDGQPGMLPVVTSGENATALLLARLWAERDHGGIVELHLAGGSVILPEWYEPRWSLGTHGLFASQAADGSVTLTAVAWDSVQKVVVRQVEGLPDGMFE